MDHDNIIFVPEDQIHFKEWLELNVNNITWEGRYEKEFDLFWQTLFPGNILLDDQVQKLQFCQKFLKTTPLVVWIKWLSNKLLCYCFLYRHMTIKELSVFFQIPIQEVAFYLRDFFIERYPHLEESFNASFHIGGVTSENANLTFEKVNYAGDLTSLRGTLEDDVIANLEIMLYPEWRNLYEELDSKKTIELVDIQQIKKNMSFKKQMTFIQELILLFLIGGLLILGLKVGNKWYEDYLVDQITLFEPNFFWLDKSLSFVSTDPLANKDVELSYNQIDELEKLESKKDEVQIEDVERFDVESDVVVASVDTLPKDFTAAELEQSDYEESQKGGYRNSRFGRQKAYRVMMSAADPGETKQRIIELLDLYQVTQADNVRPGTQIPGGLYFNLYVPHNFLKEFLSKVSVSDDSTILESKTRFPGPQGMNKVFIWIKSI